jgi:hypothetical protein
MENWPWMLVYVAVMGSFVYGLVRFCLKVL